MMLFSLGHLLLSPPASQLWDSTVLLSKTFLKITCQHDKAQYTTAGSDSVKLQLMLKTIPGTRKGNNSSVSKKTNKTLPGQQQLQHVKALPPKC